MNFLKKGFHLFKGVFLLILLVFLVWYVLFALQESDMSAQGTLVERPETERQVCL